MEENLAKKFRRKNLIRGILIFTALSLLGLSINFVWRGSHSVFYIIKNVHYVFLFLLIGMVLFDWLIGGFRLHIFAIKINPSMQFISSVRANLANMFMGAITPSQTGGGLASLYVLRRAGLSWAGGLALSVINFIATLLFFLSGIFYLIFIQTDLFSGKILFLIQYSLGFCCLIIGLYFLGIFSPSSLPKLLKIISYPLCLISERIQRLIIKIASKLENLLRDTKEHTKLFLGKEKKVLFLSLLVTIILYFNKFLIAYVILRVMGLEVGIKEVIYVQILLYFIAYFAPTPGASGIVEVSAALLMAVLIPSKGIPMFTLFWRFFSIYLAVILGGYILFHQLHRDFKTIT